MNRSLIEKLTQSVTEALILAAAAILLALAVNCFSPAGLPLTRPYQPPAPPANAPSFAVIDAATAAGLLHKGGVVFVDARPAEEYAAGHIPGARSFPVYQFDDYAATFLQAVQPGASLVVYCTGVNCSDSHLLADKLVQLGYPNIRIFSGGMAAWREKGYAVETK